MSQRLLSAHVGKELLPFGPRKLLGRDRSGAVLRSAIRDRVVPTVGKVEWRRGARENERVTLICHSGKGRDGGRSNLC